MAVEHLTKFVIRTVTNNGDKAKQYFRVSKSEKYCPALIVRKLVLSDDYNLWSRNFVVLKKFKNRFLFEQVFAIRIETLKKVVETLNEEELL